MSNGDIVVDVIRESDPDILEQSKNASRDYWVDGKGYNLISDFAGKDFVRSFESSIQNATYTLGKAKFISDGDIILVYER